MPNAPGKPDPFSLGKPHGETEANFALMDSTPEAMHRYWRLAVETWRHIEKLRIENRLSSGPSWFEVDRAKDAVRFLTGIEGEDGTAALIRRWMTWHQEYEVINDRSPKWRLLEMISTISETHHGISWPNRWERDVWEWAMSMDEEVECPFYDRRGTIDLGFRQRLRRTVEEAGGFLYRCEETRQIVFAPSDQLDAIWRHQDHLSAIARDKPFGFFHDASRPNFPIRPMTEQEEAMLAAIRTRVPKQVNWCDRVRALWKKFRH